MTNESIQLLIMTELLELAACFVDQRRDDLLAAAGRVWDTWMGAKAS